MTASTTPSENHYQPHVLIAYTDGACKGNPGPGGWGAIIRWPDGRIRELGAYQSQVTNNRMEMQAVLAVLDQIQNFEGSVIIHSDSRYVINGISSWVFGWVRNDWKTASGAEVLNQDIWKALLALITQRKKNKLPTIQWVYVPGHAGVPGNERADQIASDFAESLHVGLYDGPDSHYSFDLTLKPPSSSSEGKKKVSSTKKAKAYSYLSYVDQKLMIHKSWNECEARVKGRSGAKFKKAISAEDEQNIIKQWGLS